MAFSELFDLLKAIVFFAKILCRLALFACILDNSLFFKKDDGGASEKLGQT